MKNELEVYAVQNNIKELALTLENVNKESTSNILYLNCVCRLNVDGTVIKNNTFNSCFYSEESGVIIFFSNKLVDKEDIEKYLNNFEVKYTIIRFLEEASFDDEDIELDLNFVSDKSDLEKIIEESLKKKIDMCISYPGRTTTLQLGYVNEEEKFIPVEGKVFEATLVFKNQLSLLISQHSMRNLSLNMATKILEDKGIVVLERGISKER